MELYSTWEGHSSQAKQVEQYKQGLMTVSSFFDNKLKYMNNGFASREAPPNPGDIFNVLENDKDPCWRFQAVLSLGLLKFHPAGRDRGDIRYIKTLLENALQSSNQNERAAAKAAKEFTLEDYNNYGTKNSDY